MVDPHRIPSQSKRSMRRYRKDSNTPATKVFQTFFSVVWTTFAGVTAQACNRRHPVVVRRPVPADRPRRPSGRRLQRGQAAGAESGDRNRAPALLGDGRDLAVEQVKFAPLQGRQPSGPGAEIFPSDGKEQHLTTIFQQAQVAQE